MLLQNLLAGLRDVNLVQITGLLMDFVPGAALCEAATAGQQCMMGNVIYVCAA